MLIEKIKNQTESDFCLLYISEFIGKHQCAHLLSVQHMVNVKQQQIIVLVHQRMASSPSKFLPPPHLFFQNAFHKLFRRFTRDESNGFQLTCQISFTSLSN